MHYPLFSNRISKKTGARLPVKPNRLPAAASMKRSSTPTSKHFRPNKFPPLEKGHDGLYEAVRGKDRSLVLVSSSRIYRVLSSP